MEFRFASPLWLWLLMALPALALWAALVAPRFRARMRHSDVTLFAQLPRAGRLLRWVPGALRAGALLLLVFAMARPQTGNVQRDVLVEGVDIMVVLDVSESMSASDFPPHPTRLEAAKRVTAEFVEGRETDRIGLVLFGLTSFTACPLTVDYDAFRQLLGRVRLNVLDGRATAIGQGLLSALHRLRESEANSKVIILVTDGDNSPGTQISPLEMAELAGQMDVRIYTIGIGPVDPRRQMVGVNPQLLREIAARSGGQAFFAQETGALTSIFEQIDEMERSDVEYNVYAQWDEIMEWFVIAALGLFLLEVALRTTRLRALP